MKFLQFGPIITEGNEAHVHHLIIYLCTGLNHTHVGESGDCNGGVRDEVAACCGGKVVAAWAVGGEVIHSTIVILRTNIL